MQPTWNPTDCCPRRLDERYPTKSGYPDEISVHCYHSVTNSVVCHDVFVQVFALGVTADSDYEPPWMAYTSSSNDRHLCLADRAAVALFVAAFHGRQDICSRLIQSGKYALCLTTNCWCSAKHRKSFIRRRWRLVDGKGIQRTCKEFCPSSVLRLPGMTASDCRKVG